MTYQGRSLDDLPLAAYSRGVVEDEPEEELAAERPQLSQQDAVALALGMEPAPKPEPAEAEAAAPSRGRGLPHLALPRFSLPKLPRPGARRPAIAAEPPFHVTAQPAMAVAHVPAALPRSAAPGVRRRARGLDLGDLKTTLRNPRTAMRDPRVLFGGMIGIGVVLLGASLLGGGNVGGLLPGASPTAAAGAGATAAPGVATVVVSGRSETMYNLGGSVGFGRPDGEQLASTWVDAAGTTLSLTGRVGSVTRTTNAELVVTITVPVNGVSATFVSQAGECTVGMAEKVFNVIGSFVCPEITSTDGRVTLKITGTYQT